MKRPNSKFITRGDDIETMTKEQQYRDIIVSYKCPTNQSHE